MLYGFEGDLKFPVLGRILNLSIVIVSSSWYMYHKLNQVLFGGIQVDSFNLHLKLWHLMRLYICASQGILSFCTDRHRQVF